MLRVGDMQNDESLIAARGGGGECCVGYKVACETCVEATRAGKVAEDSRCHVMTTSSTSTLFVSYS